MSSLDYNGVTCFIVGSVLALSGLAALLLKDQYKNRKGIAYYIIDLLKSAGLRAKEHCRAKKRLLISFLMIAATLVGGLTFLEMRNLSRFNAVQQRADALKSLADSYALKGDDRSAKEFYLDASALFAPLKNLFSPILKLNAKSNNQATTFSRLADGASGFGGCSCCRNRFTHMRTKADLDSANLALTAGSMFEARDGFKRVLENPFAPVEMAQAAQAGVKQAQALITEFETGKPV